MATARKSIAFQIAPASTGGGGPVPPAGFFGNVSTNLPSAVDPCPAGNCPWVIGTSSGFEGIFNLWNGGVWASSLGQHGALLIYGGGHDGYSGNEVIAYLIQQQVFARIGFPSPYSENVRNSFGEYPDGQPTLGHQYDGIVFVPPGIDADPMGCVLKIDNAGDGAISNPWIHRLPLSTGPNTTGGWNRYCDRGAAGFSGSYCSAVWDPTRNRIWLLGGLNSYYNGFGYITPGATTGTLTVLANQGSNSDINTNLGLCLQHDMLVQFCDYGGSGDQPRLIGRPCTGSGYFDFLTTSGSPLPWTGAGFSWSTALSCFVAYEGNGSTRVHKITPPATNPLTNPWNVTTVNLIGQNGAVPALAYYGSGYNGTWGRFSEVPPLCDATRAVFVFADGKNNPAQLWSLPRP